jgi:hypothetical protein
MHVQERVLLTRGSISLRTERKNLITLTSCDYAALRIAILALVQNFRIEFAPCETGKKYDKEFLASFMMAMRPLDLTFTSRCNI